MGNAESSSSNNNKNVEEDIAAIVVAVIAVVAVATVAAGAWAALAWATSQLARAASQLLSSNRSQAQEQYANYNNTSPYDNYYGHNSIVGNVLEGAPSDGSGVISCNPYKINCDASIQNNAAGIGYIIRDDQGEMIAAEAIFNEFITDITEAEAEAIRKGLEVALQIGLKDVILETDNETVAYMINGKGSPGKRMENIICEVFRVKSKFNQCEVKYVKRRANGCADYLAELGATGKPWRFGQDPVPQGLLLRLEKDKIGGATFLSQAP